MDAQSAPLDFAIRKRDLWWPSAIVTSMLLLGSHARSMLLPGTCEPRSSLSDKGTLRE